MQRVADALDVTKMALYRYLAGKAELLACMIEQAVGDPPDLAHLSGGWRPKLQAWARQMWASWDCHTWLPGATTTPAESCWSSAAVPRKLPSR